MAPLLAGDVRERHLVAKYVCQIVTLAQSGLSSAGSQARDFSIAPALEITTGVCVDQVRERSAP
jgi:hypothetical protein